MVGFPKSGHIYIYIYNIYIYIYIYIYMYIYIYIYIYIYYIILYYIDFDNKIKNNFFISPPNTSIPVFLHLFDNIRNIPMAKQMHYNQLHFS